MDYVCIHSNLFCQCKLLFIWNVSALYHSEKRNSDQFFCMMVSAWMFSVTELCWRFKCMLMCCLSDMYIYYFIQKQPYEGTLEPDHERKSTSEHRLFERPLHEKKNSRRLGAWHVAAPYPPGHSDTAILAEIAPKSSYCPSKKVLLPLPQRSVLQSFRCHFSEYSAAVPASLVSIESLFFLVFRCCYAHADF